MRVFFLHNSQKTKKHYIPLDNIMLDDTVIKINNLRVKPKKLKNPKNKSIKRRSLRSKKCANLDIKKKALYLHNRGGKASGLSRCSTPEKIT